MSCTAKNRNVQPKGKPLRTPDCAASKSTAVTTPEGEKLRVNFNMGTDEVTYDEIPAPEQPDGKNG